MPAYLSGWDNRAKIVIDHTKIDAALVNFPVAIPISASCGQGDQDLSAIFDELELDANRTKIAVTTDDGQTQCYVEIEHWDDANELAMLHVKVPAISADEDTILYLYYDAEQTANTDFVGDTGDTAAQNVWDSNFAGVWHMAQDPSGGAGAILDSTSNGNDGTPAGTMLTEDLVDGLEGARGIDFDGTDDEINIGSDASIDDLQPIFIESVLNADGFGEGGHGRIFCKQASSNANGLEFYLTTTDDKLQFACRTDADDGAWSTPTDSILVSTDYYAAVHMDRTSAPASHVDPVIHLNGTKPALTENFTPTGSWSTDASQNGIIGNRTDGDRNFDGIISEFRISDTDRGDAWAKATYHTLFDTLVTWQTVDFDNRFKIAIDHTKIDADLTDFPVMIKISDDSGQGGADLTAVFDELTTNAERFKIAVTTSDGETQCPVEIEYWDVASETAILHTKVPAVDNDVSTVLYLHYDAGVPDNTLFVGDTGDTPAQEVWDSDYQAVYHMTEDPAGGGACNLESTANGYDATTYGTVAAATGQLGKASDHSTGYMSPGVDLLSLDFTVEALINPDSFLAADDGKNTVVYPGGDQGLLQVRGDAGNIGKVANYIRTGSSTGDYHMTTGLLSTGAWSHIASKYSEADQETNILIDGVVDLTDAVNGYNASQSGTLTIGAQGLAGPYRYFDGKIDEIRLSTIARSDAWIKATYETLFDTLLSFGTTKGYLPGFNNRVQIDIDSDLIDADLTDFPVTLQLSEAAGISGLDMRRVFEVIQASGDNKKIAVTTADGLTQCPVEIEYWDHATKTAVLHVRVPHVESSADTVLYFYFDNSAADNDSFVGDTGDAVAQTVWDDDFVGVWHLAQDPSGGAGAMLDSTVNANHMTSLGTMLTEDLIDATPGKGVAFDGTDDGLYIASPSNIPTDYPITLEAAGPGLNKASDHSSPYIGISDASDNDQVMMISCNNGKARMLAYGTSAAAKIGTVTVVDDEFVHYTAKMTSATSRDVFTNGADKQSDTTSQSFAANVDRISIGYISAAAPTLIYMEGKNSECRVSSVARSDAWILATYHTLADTLVTFSNFESADFKKRRKITIDSDLIDEPLVDFPLAIPLGTSAGIGDEDLSDIFAELKFPASDAFYGGSAFDTTRWEITGQAANVSVVDNALQGYADSGDTSGERQGVLSKFKLDYTEDFDVRVNFEVTAGPATDKWWVGIEAYFFDQAGGSVGGPPTWDTGGSILRGYDAAYGQCFAGTSVEDTSWETTDRDVNTATKGRLRLVYNATTPSLTGYYDAGAGWVALNTFTYTDVDATDALICLTVYNSDSQPTVTAKLSNFDVYEGVVKWPDGEPNRKKLKVTLNDLITECPVEIEHLDVDGQTGILHTKIPYISAAEDTEIYLHYDCDQPDNSNVGDTGDAIAQEVWDDDFESVWHLVGQGDGTSDEFKDSTSNNNHGEASQGAGTIPTLDALGPKGYSQDFDGGDCLTFPISSILGAKSIEVLGATNGGAGGFWDTGGASSARHGNYFGIDVTGNKLRAISSKGSAPVRFDFKNGALDCGDGVFRTYSHVWDGTTDADEAKGFVNGVEQCQGTAITTEGTSPDGITTMLGGYYYDSGGGYNPTLDGNISEVRVSAGVRSDAWLKATYHTLFDTLLTWSDPDCAAPWLGTWAKRRKFTISAAVIDAELVDFPIALPIDASCGIGADDLSGLFTELSTANKKKMAITLGDKLTECYFELENWDSVNSKGIIHTRGPIIQLGKDTELYIYYDSAQSENAKAGVPGDAVAAKVWDSSYRNVQHLADDSLLDSTSIGNDGTNGGTSDVAGILGQGRDFEIDESDYITFGDTEDINGESFTASIAYKIESTHSITTRLAQKRGTGAWGTRAGWQISISVSPTDWRNTGVDDGGGNYSYMDGVTAGLVVGTWYHCAFVFDSTTGNLKLYNNGECINSKTAASLIGANLSNARHMTLGCAEDGGSRSQYFDGIMDEYRFSNVARSDAWILATYHALFDTFGTWGSEEEFVSDSGAPNVYAVLEAPAEITYSVPAALVSISVEPGAPAEITYSVPGAVVASIGAIVGTPEITYSVPAATVVQNLNAIGIMSKPNVSAKKPSATVTAKKPGATATGSGPSATVTAKGD